MPWGTKKAADLAEGDLVYHEHAVAFIKEVKVDGGSVTVVLDRSTHSAEFQKMMTAARTEELETVELCYDDDIKTYVPEGEEIAFREGASDETNNKAHKGPTIEVDVEKIMKEMIADAKKALGKGGRKK